MNVSPAQSSRGNLGNSPAVIDWRMEAADILAGAWRVGRIRGETVVIVAAHCGGIKSAYTPGTVIRCDDQVWVQTAKGQLVLDRVCRPGGQEATAAEVFHSMAIQVGDCFDSPGHVRVRAA